LNGPPGQVIPALRRNTAQMIKDFGRTHEITQASLRQLARLQRTGCTSSGGSDSANLVAQEAAPRLQ
jgi:hypothetical protein